MTGNSFKKTNRLSAHDLEKIPEQQQPRRSKNLITTQQPKQLAIKRIYNLNRKTTIAQRTIVRHLLPASHDTPKCLGSVNWQPFVNRKTQSPKEGPGSQKHRVNDK
ncbi:hypothetical protein [Cohaesibacter haloalkalitolerans]|uniref:hypothetical protein n=1 Tax=Cohaesibacter haloalkalitolerans TaxID=1162980 RepID=UPI000E65E7F6|nr:hypothetical protein [Cohaesibacter haloalkalitolerans]